MISGPSHHQMVTWSRPRTQSGRHRFGRRGAYVAGVGHGRALLQRRDGDIEQIGIVVDEDVLHRLGLRLPRCRV